MTIWISKKDLEWFRGAGGGRVRAVIYDQSVGGDTPFIGVAPSDLSIPTGKHVSPETILLARAADALRRAQVHPDDLDLADAIERHLTQETT